jgi:error-prone DNA polymerase
MPLGQQVMTDYSTIGMSLKRHPLSLIRPTLDEMRITPCARLADLEQERWVKIAGLVLIRQRPATASGVVFETLEDETGTANVIIRPDIYERYRAASRHAALLECDGYIERSGQVIHVMAKRLIDLSHLLQDLEVRSRDFH